MDDLHELFSDSDIEYIKSKRTRDPERIRPFLNELAILWQTMPDMRFFQLVRSIEGMVDPTHRGKQTVVLSTGAEVDQVDCFYTEDEEALKAIRMYWNMLDEPFV